MTFVAVLKSREGRTEYFQLHATLGYTPTIKPDYTIDSTQHYLKGAIPLL